MPTNDSPNDGQPRQKSADGYEQAKLDSLTHRSVILQQLEREIRTHRREHGGQDDIRRWTA